MGSARRPLRIPRVADFIASAEEEILATWTVGRRYMSQGSLAGLYAEEDDQAGRIITHPVLVPVH